MTRTLIAAAVLAALLAVPIAGQVIDDDTVSVTTAADGSATALSRVMRGRVVYIYYKDGFDDTADFTITCDRTGEGLWTEANVTAAKIVAPTKAVQDLVGIDRAQFDYVWCVGSKIRIVIAQGGNVNTAVFEIVVF